MPLSSAPLLPKPWRQRHLSETPALSEDLSSFGCRRWSSRPTAVYLSAALSPWLQWGPSGEGGLNRVGTEQGPGRGDQRRPLSSVALMPRASVRTPLHLRSLLLTLSRGRRSPLRQRRHPGNYKGCGRSTFCGLPGWLCSNGPMGGEASSDSSVAERRRARLQTAGGRAGRNLDPPEGDEFSAMEPVGSR